MKETYEICSKSYPVLGYAKVIDEQGNYTGEKVPLVDLPMMSDYHWQLEALESRLKKPETYRTVDGDVLAVMEHLVQWISQHTTPELYEKFKDKYKMCYDFIKNKEAKTA